ncbi:MAG: hypothetical protein KME05_13330 [Gloeocapsa sp. UFS-A4-WI-NPMV-4B04]|nr:hypothetical protein [Gloeocapsa sp. UFS-A4-WI-NPMV-4B04]
MIREFFIRYDHSVELRGSKTLLDANLVIHQDNLPPQVYSLVLPPETKGLQPLDLNQLGALIAASGSLFIEGINKLTKLLLSGTGGATINLVSPISVNTQENGDRAVAQKTAELVQVAVGQVVRQAGVIAAAKRTARLSMRDFKTEYLPANSLR